MHLLSSATANGVTERAFVHDGLPGVLWTPAAARPTALILSAHGGGQHKRSSGVVDRATRCVAAGFAVVTLDAPGHGDRPRSAEYDGLAAEMRAAMTSGQDISQPATRFNARIAEQAVPEWRSVLDALTEAGGLVDTVERTGFWGVSMGSAVGIPLVAAETRIRAAVFGLVGANDTVMRAAEKVKVPLRFLLQWDDRVVTREAGVALFDAFAAPCKALHVNPGGHGKVPLSEMDDAVRFLAGQLALPPETAESAGASPSLTGGARPSRSGP